MAKLTKIRNRHTQIVYTGKFHMFFRNFFFGRFQDLARRVIPYHRILWFLIASPAFTHCQLINATDTRLLWRIESPRKCENKNCPIREDFHLLVEQDQSCKIAYPSGDIFFTTIFFTSKFMLFLHQCFLHQFFLHQILKFRKIFFGKKLM